MQNNFPILQKSPVLLLLNSNPGGFPGGSDGKESICNAGNLGSIPGLGRPLENEMESHSSIFVWEVQWTEEPGGYSPWDQKEANTTEWLTLSLSTLP